MADRFEELRILVAVADAGGVNAAAARLGLAKSAVSRRLSLLEQRIGVELVSRRSRRFALTPEGLAYHARAKALLADLDALDGGAATGAASRSLSVSAPLELATHVVAPALAGISGRRSDFAARLSVDDADADVVFTISMAGRRPTEGEVGRTPVARYAAAHSDEPSIQPGSREIDVRDPPTWFPSPVGGAPATTALSVGALDMALAAAIGGGGAVSLPEFMAADAIDGGRLIVLPDPRIGPTLSVVATTKPGVDARELIEGVGARLKRA